jgi:polyferredoxin
VLGRFFCGWACHVVAYQDLCAWALRRVGLRPRPVRSRLLVLVPLGAALYMFLWPQVARWLERRPFPGLELNLATDDLWATFPGPWIALITLLVDGFLIVWLLGAKGFCTYGCPYGAVFGLAERAARGRIRVTDACEGCGHCTATCTSNVRVHAEVARFGQVVDPGCMKCMDCVSVCPKEALYFGFLARHSRARERRSLWAFARGPARAYDFTWPEELALAAVFLASLLALRGLYDAVPFLLAIGLAVMAALAAVTLVRTVRARDFELQGHVLRRGGAWTRSGVAIAATFVLLLLFVGHSGVVQASDRAGTRLLLRAGELQRGEPEREALLGSSLVHLSRAERWGLAPVAELEFKLASILRERGQLEEAERRMRRSIELDPVPLMPHLALADVLIVQGRFPEAEAALLELLELEPGFAPAEARLAALRSAQ